MDLDVSEVREQLAHVIIDVQPGDTEETMSKQKREEAAKTLFISILRKYEAMQQLSVEEMVEMYGYSDLMECDVFVRWEQEAIGRSNRNQIWLDDGRLACRFSILADVYQFCCLFTDEFYTQMGMVRFPGTLVPFQGDEGCGLFPTNLLPTGMKEPCAPHTPNLDVNASFGPWSEQNKRLWPTIVIDMAASSEDMSTLLARRDWYLGKDTQVNVWIGAKYFKSEGTWWMGVARRTARGCLGENDAPKWIGRLQGVEDGEEFESVTTSRKEVWIVPARLLFHPDTVPDREPPYPEGFVVEVEKYRQRLTNPTEEGPM